MSDFLNSPAPVIPLGACDFCGKPENTPGLRFISNPQHMAVDAWICEECVAVCVKVFAETKPITEPAQKSRRKKKEPAAV